MPCLSEKERYRSNPRALKLPETNHSKSNRRNNHAILRLHKPFLHLLPLGRLHSRMVRFGLDPFRVQERRDGLGCFLERDVDDGCAADFSQRVRGVEERDEVGFSEVVGCVVRDAEVEVGAVAVCSEESLVGVDVECRADVGGDFGGCGCGEGEDAGGFAASGEAGKFEVVGSEALAPD